MLKLRLIIAMFSAAMIVLGAGAVYGQDFPNRPIRIFTGGAGGGSDFMARQIAQGISGPLGQPIVVENRPSGLIPADTVAKAAPDGYTVLLSGSNFYILTLLQKAPYDPVKDFSFITSTDTSCNILVVHPSVPANSVKELIALAKAKPGTLNFGSSGVGGPDHLAGELFKSMAGINIVSIRYKTGADALNGIFSGEVHMTIDSSQVVPHFRSGKLRALAVTSANPSVLFPELPTIAASGLPGFEAVSITGVFAPAKTPISIINRLNQEIVRFINTPELKQRLLSMGIEPAGASPEEFAAKTRANIAKWDKVIKDAGIKVE